METNQNKKKAPLFTVDETHPGFIKNLPKEYHKYLNKEDKTDNKTKIVTYIILLKFLKSTDYINDEIEEVIYDENSIQDYFDTHSFLICKGFENLEYTIINLLKTCEFVDLENSIIISDNKTLSESLGFLNDTTKNSIFKFMNINNDLKQILEDYLEVQSEYLDSFGEVETYGGELASLYEEVKNLNINKGDE